MEDSREFFFLQKYLKAIICLYSIFIEKWKYQLNINENLRDKKQTFSMKFIWTFNWFTSEEKTRISYHQITL